MKIKLVDTHAHLYVKEFASDIGIILERAQANGVEKIYLPAIDSTEHSNLLHLAERFPEICLPMMGLHPCSVKENYKGELVIVEKLLGEHRFYAVGEIGLDYYWDKTYIAEQKTAFSRQIEMAVSAKLPIAIHSRQSTSDCIEIVKQYQDGNLKGVFHCFSGTEAEARQIVDLGFYLGIGGVITYKNAGLAEILVNIPVENLVLETDSPYLSPVPYRGKRNESSYLGHILDKLSAVKGMDKSGMAAITTQNAEKLFGR